VDVRKVKRWRYYCDYCDKGGCSGGVMAKHERGCTRNPERQCGLCRVAKLEQKPTAELLAALNDGGVDAVLELSLGCPACVVAAIHALRKTEPRLYEPDTGADNYISFDYKLAAEKFWNEVNAKEYSY
jgi:hypothetical protein